MKKINLKRLEEEIIYEKLDNGLEVYLYNKDTAKNNYVTFTTKYGSVYNEFIPIDKDKYLKVPNGIAHFLEHKMFEQEEGPEVMDFYAQNGAMCNAFTTFKNTTYLFSGPNKLEENLEFLLDYVQNLYLTIDSVEKEKGIITQEIKMCDDRPSDILYEQIRKASFVNSAFRESIIGTKEEVNSITKELLETCYNTFYHPSNMFLVITGNFDSNKILELIKNNQAKKEFKDESEIKIKIKKEPDKVVKDKVIKNIDSNISKFSYNIKVPINNFNMSKRKINLYLYIIFSILFDETSNFDEELKKEKIITSSLSINLLNADTHILVSLINETNKTEELLNKIKKQLKNIDIKKEDFERKKKVLISNEIFSFENIEDVNDMIMDSIIYDGYLEDNLIGIISSLSIEELKDFIKKLDLKNTSVVILEKNN